MMKTSVMEALGRLLLNAPREEYGEDSSLLTEQHDGACSRNGSASAEQTAARLHDLTIYLGDER